MERGFDELLDAMLAQVPFDGWSRAAMDAAAAAIGLSPAEARALAPRGPVGLAAAWHRRGDDRMLELLAATDLGAMRFRDRIALAVRFRLDGTDTELARRAAALYALPQHAAEGSRLLWGTADAIWKALGDASDDINWYTKRLSLAGVLGAVSLYWLGDTSEGRVKTWAFLDRRIEDVMRIETVKARLRDNPLLRRAMESKLNPLNHVHAPRHQGDWPGRDAR
jgi:ubiquinone biosynthesis protein COQ9